MRGVKFRKPTMKLRNFKLSEAKKIHYIFHIPFFQPPIIRGVCC